MPPARYLRICELARGGMGTVELVLRREGSFERTCARKRLHPHFHEDEAFRAMFLDEARLAGAIRHANVVSVIDVGQDADGPFLIMDFVDGVPLGDLVAAGPLPVQLAVRIALEIALGLHAAHEARDADGTPLGLVHRDVSPQNVLVGWDGRVAVTDFGIARAYGNATRTATGVLKGNVGYLSPEQLRFEEPDRRSDLFSLGVVLYELLAGERLYTSRDAAENARRILNDPPPDIANRRRDVSAALVELLFEVLARDPARRPATAAALAARLEALLAELVDEEGALDLAPHLAATFGDRRATELEARNAAVRAAREAEAQATLAERLRAERLTRRRRRARGSLAATALLLGLGGVAWIASRRPPPVPGEARTVWAGGWHSCGLHAGGLYCWGRNNAGQLGIGASVDRVTRVAVPGVGRVVSAALGYFHTCVCSADGHVRCFGQDLEGQLGVPPRGAATAPNSARPPAEVPGLRDCAEVAAGAFHTCVRTRDRRVLCFGENSHGQVGLPGPDSPPPVASVGPPPMWGPASAGHGVSTPVEVTGARGALQLAAGQDFTCALRADGRVLCWGANDQGQLGDGTRARRPKAHVPASVVNLDDAVEVAAGRYFSCARRRSHAGRGGRVVCWGANNSGQLGDRSKTARTRPVLVAGLEDAVQLAAGRGHACALRLTADGESPIVCWGSHEAGVRGAGNTKTSELGLTTVASATRLLSLTSGDLHLCARHPDGVACWGRNSSGQLGDGTGYDRLTPVSTGGAWE